MSALFLVLSVLARQAGLPEPATELLTSVHQKLTGIMPMLVAAAIGYMLSIRHRVPHLPTAFLCLSYVAVAETLLAAHPLAASTLTLFVAIISPLAAVPLLSWLHRFRWTRLAPDGLTGENVRETLNMVVPGILTAAVLIGALSALLSIPGVAQFSIPVSLTSLQNPYATGALISALNSLLWFFGIHGYHALAPIMDVLDQAAYLNAAINAAGYEGVYALNSSLMGAFTFIGGAGATLSLAVSILLFSRTESLRMLAVASVPASLLNVNEILLFGLPLILNPRLLIPFMLAPVCNTLIALAVVQLGWLPPAAVTLPLTSPVLVNAYLSTGGHLGGIVLQLGLLALGVCLYTPFVLALERRQLADATVYFKSLDTTFPRLQDESLLYVHDPLINTYADRARRSAEITRIRAISEYDFYLEYQPQVSLRSGRCTGCEAVARHRPRRPATGAAGIPARPGPGRPDARRRPLGGPAGGGAMPELARAGLRAAHDDQRHQRYPDVHSPPGKLIGAGAGRRAGVGGIDRGRAGRGRRGTAHGLRPPAPDRRAHLHRRFRHRLLGAQLPAPVPHRRGQDRPQLRAGAKQRTRRAGHERPAAILRGAEPQIVVEGVETTGRRSNRAPKSSCRAGTSARRRPAPLMDTPGGARPPTARLLDADEGQRRARHLRGGQHAIPFLDSVQADQIGVGGQASALARIAAASASPRKRMPSASAVNCWRRASASALALTTGSRH